MDSCFGLVLLGDRLLEACDPSGSVTFPWFYGCRLIID